MPQERCEGIVLRHVDWSETSRVVTFLTPSRGRMACMVAGARRPKSSLGPLLDTFNRVELVYYWKDGRSVQKLAEASLLDGYGGLKASLDKTLYGAFPLELALKTAQENEPSEALYDALRRGLEGINAWTGDIATHAAWHTLRLLTAAGFAPWCPEPTGKRARFAFSSGVVEDDEPGDRVLSAEGHAALYAMTRAAAECPPLTAPMEVFDALYGFACRQLDTDFRSVHVLRRVQA